MASLALMVAIIFFFVILIGPIGVIISHFKIVPNFIAYFLAIISIATGMWWFLLPTTAIRFLGIVPVFCGYYIINNRKNKTGQHNPKNQKD